MRYDLQLRDCDFFVAQMPATPEDLERELRVLVSKCDVSSCTVKEIRRQLEGVIGEDLSDHKDQIKALVTQIMAEAVEADDDAGEDEGEEEDEDEDVGGTAERPKKAKRVSSGDAVSWVLSEELMLILGVDSPDMTYKEVRSMTIFFFSL